MKIVKLLPVICTALMFAGCSFSDGVDSATVTNGEVWTDSDGNAIETHDNIIKYGSKYYWYGLDYSHNLRSGDGEGFRAVKCYESEDLVNWTFKNNVLTATSSDLLYYADVNTPNVVYNSNTGKFVMWMGYSQPSYTNQNLVATCSSPYGDFEVINGRFAVNDGAVITSLFKDSDNTCYLLTYATDSDDDVEKLFIYSLSDDYLTVNASITSLYPTRQIGRANIIKYNGYYYMFMDDYGLTDSGNDGTADYSCAYFGFWTSGYASYTGVRYAYATSLSGTWSGEIEFGPDDYTDQEFSSIITVSGESHTSYLLAFNKWNSDDLAQSGYVWQPLSFEKSAETFYEPTFSEYAAVTIDASAGTVHGE